MMSACDNTPIGTRDAAILGLLYMCGLRRAELVALDLADYDPETHSLKVLHAKGNKQRWVPVGNGARAALADWLVLRGEQPGPLFTQVLRGGHIKARCLTTQAVWHIVQRRADEAGIKSLTPHDFRRTLASDLLDAGVDISIVAKILGHSDISTTARYDHRDEPEMRQATDRLHLPYVRKASA
jgi:site-specific recombinase XerD